MLGLFMTTANGLFVGNSLILPLAGVRTFTRGINGGIRANGIGGCTPWKYGSDCEAG